MPTDKQREIASKGGRAAHVKGTAHEWTPDEARSAGRKGAQASRDGRGRTAAPEPTTPGTSQPGAPAETTGERPSTMADEVALDSETETSRNSFSVAQSE
jgi:hypothetical protein